MLQVSIELVCFWLVIYKIHNCISMRSVWYLKVCAEVKGFSHQFYNCIISCFSSIRLFFLSPSAARVRYISWLYNVQSLIHIYICIYCVEICHFSFICKFFFLKSLKNWVLNCYVSFCFQQLKYLLYFLWS